MVPTIDSKTIPDNVLLLLLLYLDETEGPTYYKEYVLCTHKESNGINTVYLGWATINSTDFSPAHHQTGSL